MVPELIYHFDTLKGEKIMSSLSARETAYQTIRSRIITMELKPGDPLNDRELAEELGISRCSC